MYDICVYYWVTDVDDYVW